MKEIKNSRVVQKLITAPQIIWNRELGPHIESLGLHYPKTQFNIVKALDPVTVAIKLSKDKLKSLLKTAFNRIGLYFIKRDDGSYGMVYDDTYWYTSELFDECCLSIEQAIEQLENHKNRRNKDHYKKQNNNSVDNEIDMSESVVKTYSTSEEEIDTEPSMLSIEELEELITYDNQKAD